MSGTGVSAGDSKAGMTLTELQKKFGCLSTNEQACRARTTTGLQLTVETDQKVAPYAF